MAKYVLRTPQGAIIGRYDTREEADEAYAAYMLQSIAIGNTSGIQGES